MYARVKAHPGTRHLYAEQLIREGVITGDDLIRAGLSPGVRFKELLELVRDAQLEGRIGTRDEALDLVKELHGDA